MFPSKFDSEKISKIGKLKDCMDVLWHTEHELKPSANFARLPCRVAQLVECLVTSGYPDGSSSGGPGSNPGENENFWKIPRIT